MRSFKFFATWALCLWVFVLTVAAQNPPPPFTIRLQTFLTGLTRPVLITHSKDGTRRLFILQQNGIIRVLQPGAAAPTDFINISSRVRVPVTTGDERGLLGLTFHPEFASNRKFYVNYTRVADGATVIAEYTTLANDPNQGDFNSERVLLTIPQDFSNHNGGMIEFGPDGFLYIGMGDGGSANDPFNRAQDPARLLGKMLRIDVNVPQGSPNQYLIPPGNPFTGANTTRCDAGSTTAGNTCQEIWAIGMRNPWRWSFDRGGTNQLWAGDVGQNAIEEISIITRGGNFGWRAYEGSTCTGLDPQLCTGGATPITHAPPISEYSHTSGRCSVTGGYVYRGGIRTLPDGAYVYADYCTGEIWMRSGGNPQVPLIDTPRLVSSFGQDEDGELYVVGIGSSVNPTGTVEKLVRARASADFDGDFRTDLSVFRPSTGIWYITNSSNNSIRQQQFGLNGDVPTPEDYDGDNISDIGVFRPSNGVWYNFRSSDNTVGITQFGLNGDIPAQGDFDGDGRADYAVFRPSTGVWYMQRSSNGSVLIQQFGLNGDIPTAGDYDNDGKYDIAVFRPSSGVWYRINSTNGSVSQLSFGLQSDIPSIGDFDGDGEIDQTVFRPSNGVWYTLRSSDSGVSINQFGSTGDVPSVGDYDGDGRDDIAVFRPSSGVWYAVRSSNASVLISQFGLSGDQPAPSFDAP
jgi:glucose/arabinose dehydrogenase